MQDKERMIKIATANSRESKIWRNTEISYDELCRRLTTTLHTEETVAEYKRMSRNDKEMAKDKGGFVPAVLKDSLRRASNVVSVSCNKMDKDSADTGFLDRLKESHPYDCIIHTTHSSTPEVPRYRILTFYTRDVTPDEDNAIGRYLAEEVYGGIGDIDPVSFRPNQMMFFPTTPKDGVFVGLHLDGPMLDPDEFLAAHPDWKDPTALPRSVKETSRLNHNKSRMEDPLEKKGIIGAFNRTYTIAEAIDSFLTDVYEAGGSEDRYRYIPSDSVPGVCVFDNKLMYSFHASDPAYGRCLNAFDMVRIHRFGQLDEDAKEHTPDTKLPSMKAMLDFAANDEAVKEIMLKEKAEQAKADFEILGDKNWSRRLTRDKNGKVENTLQNVTLILRNDPELQGIRYNQFADLVEITAPVPWNHPNSFWRDADDAHLIGYLTDHYGDFSKRNYEIGWMRVTDERSFHPVREYLDSLPKWDGIKRIETVFIDYLGAKDTPYVRTVTRNTFCGAVRRIKIPGCKHDWMPVFDGGQGIGKSTLIRLLAEPWYSDSLILKDMQDKTAAEKLQGMWIIEIGELAGIRKSDDDIIKAFLSRQDDKYRGAYLKRVTPHPRQCIFFGTTNEQFGYLRDRTGGRRFWSVKVTGKGKYHPWELDKATVDQLWAEALVVEPTLGNLDIPPELEETAKTEQRLATESSDKDGLVEDYLETLLPKNWDVLNSEERKCFYESQHEDEPLPEPGTLPPCKYASHYGLCCPSRCPHGITKGTEKRMQVSRMEIWCECF